MRHLTFASNIFCFTWLFLAVRKTPNSWRNISGVSTRIHGNQFYKIYEEISGKKLKKCENILFAPLLLNSTDPLQTYTSISVSILWEIHDSCRHSSRATKFGTAVLWSWNKSFKFFPTFIIRVVFHRIITWRRL